MSLYNHVIFGFGLRLMDGSPATIGRAGHDFINDPLMLYGSGAE
jgi:hypothetical protein